MKPVKTKITEPEEYKWTYLTGKQPYTCPVCGGNGKVQNGFYNTVTGMGTTSDATPEQCRTCVGTGIVWG